MLTSRYTLDARNPAIRREIAGLADLVGAVRLPGGAHRAAAGTQVVTDLLVLRRREPGRPADGIAWERTRAVEAAGGQVLLNEYFADHPNSVLGELAAGRGAYGAGELMVHATGPAAPGLAAALGRLAVQAAVRGLRWSPPTPGQTVRRPAALLGQRSGLREGCLLAQADGGVVQVADGQLQPYPVPAGQAGELRALLGLRDTVVALLQAEAASLDDVPELDRLRADLNSRYDAYTAVYGPLNRFSVRRTGRLDPATGVEGTARIRPRQGGFRSDPFAPTVYALERFDPATQTATKASIFTERVVAPRAPRLGADTPADALAICLDSHGQPRLAEIARLLGLDLDQARVELGTLVFDEPGTGRLVLAADYLSGNVRVKLAAARAAATDDPRFTANVEVWAGVIPAELGPAEIHAQLGAAWVDAGTVEQFLRELLDDESIAVEHPGGAVWAVRGAGRSVLASNTWGTSRAPAPELAQDLLEQRQTRVYDQIGTGQDKRRVLNVTETTAAQEKAAQLNARFGEWVWEEPARATRLARVYNDRFNSIVLRSYDDVRLSLPGLALSFTPRRHQVAAVARIINEPAVLLGHVVGAGKTAEMAIGAMELRRLRLVHKPAIVVPNHMLEQFSREFLQLYPQARVLVAGRDDLDRDHRRALVARIATGDWDAVVISRSAFERIPMSLAAQKAYLDREIAAFHTWIANANTGSDRPLTVKRMQAALERAEERIKAKLDSVKDPGISFEQTGIDYLLVDEAHGYKNLRTPSNILGAAIDGSQRASDLDMKLDWLRATHGNRVATFATGTPIANSITELHVMQRYLRPDLLAEAGVADFDTWAGTFGEVVTDLEVSPDGGSFRMQARFARFRNVPELLRMWHVSADIKTVEDLNLPRPQLAGGMPETVVVAPSAQLRAYVAGLGERAELIRSRAVDPTVDNMLKVTGDGRAAALDVRLVGLRTDEPAKIDAAADSIAAIWAEHRDDEFTGPDGTIDVFRGSFQIVFCDLGTPHPDSRWTAYDELRRQLVARGLPAGAVRFVHEARNDRETAELFAGCRAGQVAVLIGSTEKMGAGTNMQTRAYALHHLDCPWRPVDIEQREGRILRQGNQHPEVRIRRYVVEGSFDSYSWQTVECKARFIGQVMRGRLDMREIEDIGDAALSASEAKALASGNPLLLDKAKADADLTRLERLDRAWTRAQDTLRYERSQNHRRIDELTDTDKAVADALARRIPTRGDTFTMRVGQTRLTKRADAGSQLRHLLLQETAALGWAKEHTTTLGELGGFPLTATTRRSVLGGIVVDLHLDGVPHSTVEIGHNRLADLAKPDALITQLQNRLDGLERLHTDLRAELSRLHTEIARADASIGKPFPQHDELLAARERAAKINEALGDQARPDNEPADATPHSAGPSDHPSPADLHGVAFPTGLAPALSLPGSNRPPRSHDARIVRPTASPPHRR